MDPILQQMINIDPKNIFIAYIVERLQRIDYRGIHISQHNRYNIKYILTIIEKIYEIVGNEYFQIPPGDYSSRTGTQSFEINEYPEYKKIVDSIYLETGKGTYNSIKKNFFVDLERMGLLLRSKDQGELWGKLTNEAIEVINLYHQNDWRRLTKKFTDLLDENLFSNYLSDLVEFMCIFGYDKIDIYEYTFIINDNQITDTYKDILLREYRHLSNSNQRKLIELIKKYANPQRFQGNKTIKKDFHNWINESQQIFSLLKYTSYFQVISLNNKQFLVLNTSAETGIFNVDVIKRNQKIKNEYFRLHKVNKEANFELHHIIPIKIAINKRDMDLIDNVMNLVYISENRHKEIHRQKTFQILDINLQEIKLNNVKNPILSVAMTNLYDTLYTSSDKKLLEKIQLYNQKLINHFRDEIKSVS